MYVWWMNPILKGMMPEHSEMGGNRGEKKGNKKEYKLTFAAFVDSA